jgi:hypothetical protein
LVAEEGPRRKLRIEVQVGLLSQSAWSPHGDWAAPSLKKALENVFPKSVLVCEDGREKERMRQSTALMVLDAVVNSIPFLSEIPLIQDPERSRLYCPLCSGQVYFDWDSGSLRATPLVQ